MRVFIALILCKLTRQFLRIIGRGGTNLPGKVAVYVCPDLLSHLAKDIKCTIITGTNGKTTTSRIIEEAHKLAGLDCIANRSGANLLTGITAEFAMNATLKGKPKKRYAVIECDEAASKKVCKYINPHVLLVTNIFRDQLDRYGEVSHTIENVRIGISNSPNAVVCLNADDSLSVSLGDGLSNKIVYYGVETPVYKGDITELSDAMHCTKCKAAYSYDYVTYAHLGGFYCPNCGFKRPNAQVAVTKITKQTPDGAEVIIRIGDHERNAVINLPGGYNIYNGVGALTAVMQSGIAEDTAVSALESFQCGFGRMEKFQLGDAWVRMILVKNPAGCNQVLNYLTSQEDKALFVVCLNDKIADGTDISWIWDVNFEKLHEMQERLSGIIVSGIRRDDMALRLKYAGFDEGFFTIAEDYSQLIETISTQQLPVFVMPTYTAMLGLRDIISSKFGYKDFWE
jgi:UDP-N-acetylmuramyl tripeptide synthase